MEKKNSNFVNIIITTSIVLLFYIIVNHTLIYSTNTSTPGVPMYNITSVTVSYGEKEYKATLPCKISNLKPGTVVKVQYRVSPDASSIYISSIYCPLEVFASGTHLFSYGKNSKTSLFVDPPVLYKIVSLPKSYKPYEVTMLYTASNTRNAVVLYPPIAGDSITIFHYLIEKYGRYVLNSLFYISLGFILMFFSLFYLKSPKHGAFFLWPGLMALSSGLWQFSNNNLVILLTRYPAVLYVTGFVSMFFIGIPLCESTKRSLNMEDNKVLKYLTFIEILSFIITLAFGIMGVVPLQKSFHFYQIFLTVTFLTLAIIVLQRLLKDRKWGDLWFFLATVFMLLSSVLEYLNYQIHFLDQMMLIFQDSLFVFSIVLGILGGIESSRIYKQSLDTLELKNDMKLQNQTIEASKDKLELMITHFDDIRKQRHDLKHHIRTMSDLLEKKRYIELSTYLSSIENSIPAISDKKYCENVIVNSTLEYYIETAINSDIDINTNIEIPRSNPHISDSDLSVIFGNLLENAIDACAVLPKGSRYISIKSQKAGEMLFITMDNSSNGNYLPNGEFFNSTKHKGDAIGLRSLKSISERHQGSAKFEALENQFRSEICVRL
ncbi:MAG: GHKL domain-containing protein [Eubacterium sp.]|nr:GHKL domain-containing protein [Eubacterium sp.]